MMVEPPHAHALRTRAKRLQSHNTSEAHAWQRRLLEASLHGDVERERDGPSREYHVLRTKDPASD